MTTTFIDDTKLAQKCQIVLEDISSKLITSIENSNVPTQTVIDKITSRRESVRLLRKTRPCMKVGAFRVWKKRRNISNIEQKQLTDAKRSMLQSQKKLTDAQQPNDKSFDTMMMSDDQLAVETKVLFNLDVNKLVDELNSFIENGRFGDFYDDLFNSRDPTDSNVNCLPLNSEPLTAELSTSVLTTPTDFIPPIASVNEISNEIFCLDEIGDLPLDLSIDQMKSNEPEWKPKEVSGAPLDLSINKIKSSGQEWKYQNDFIESANSLTTPHAPVNTSSACCSSNELFNSNTVITSKLNQDASPSASPMIVDSIQKNEPVTKGNDSAINSKKRSRWSKQKIPSQAFIQNYNVNNCSTNRKIFNFKIPKLNTFSTEENISNDFCTQEISQNFSKIHSNNSGQLNLTLSPHDSSTISHISTNASTQPKSSTASSPNLRSTQTKSFTHYQRERPMQRENCPELKAQLPMPAAIGLLQTQDSFVAKQKMVLRLLNQPCFKFLLNEACGPYCRYNHLLPSTPIVAATIKNWPNELIHHFYLTCVHQPMCFIMYFSVVCNIFAERHMSNSLITAIKDCERLSNVHYFKSIFMALMHCGMSPDQSLFFICINSNRSLDSIQVILEIMCSFNLNIFIQAAAFISTQIENYEINPILAITILEKAYADSPLSTVMRNVCITMLRKSMENQTFNQTVLELFLTKILT